MTTSPQDALLTHQEETSQGEGRHHHHPAPALCPRPLRQRIVERDEVTQIRWVTNLEDAPLHFGAKIKDPLLFREAVAMLYDVVRSDLRRAPKDRAAYLEHQRSRGGTSSDEAFGQQSAFFAAQNEASTPQEDQWFVMPPTLSVHPDQLTLEVFSKDEGTYASLAISAEAFEGQHAKDATWGCAQLDFSTPLHDALGLLRSWRDTELAVGPGKASDQTRQLNVDVPNAWLRGFLQVQASATPDTNLLHPWRRRPLQHPASPAPKRRPQKGRASHARRTHARSTPADRARALGRGL